MDKIETDESASRTPLYRQFGNTTAANERRRNRLHARAQSTREARAMTSLRVPMFGGEKPTTESQRQQLENIRRRLEKLSPAV